MAAQREGGFRRAGSAMNDILGGVPLQLSARVGSVTMTMEEVGKLEPGAVVQFDAKVGEAVTLLANGFAIAQGELVMVDDRYGVRVTALAGFQ